MIGRRRRYASTVVCTAVIVLFFIHQVYYHGTETNSHDHSPTGHNFADFNDILFHFNSTVPGENYYKLRDYKINPYIFSDVLAPRDVCNISNPPYLLVLIPSTAEHMDVRNSIRKTWGSVATTGHWPHKFIRQKVKVVFLLAKRSYSFLQRMLVEESERYGDILQGDFKDSYYNLSTKILMGLRWASESCKVAKFILKADDDTFVDIPAVIDLVMRENNDETILGYVYGISPVKRHGVWKVSTEIFPFTTYPKYVASEYMPYIPVEDAYITGILGKVVGATHRHVPSMTFWYQVAPKPCDFHRKIKISATKVTMDLMQEIWLNFQNNGKDCSRIAL